MEQIKLQYCRYKKSKLISMALKFGSQSIVLSIEAKKNGENYWEAYTNTGRDHTGLNIIIGQKKVLI